MRKHVFFILIFIMSVFVAIPNTFAELPKEVGPEPITIFETFIGFRKVDEEEKGITDAEFKIYSLNKVFSADLLRDRNLYNININNIKYRNGSNDSSSSEDDGNAEEEKQDNNNDEMIEDAGDIIIDDNLPIIDDNFQVNAITKYNTLLVAHASASEPEPEISIDFQDEEDYTIFLTESQREWLNSIKTMEDLQNYYETGKYNYDFTSKESFILSLKNNNGINIDYDNHSFAANFLTFLVIEETRTPAGLKKEKMVVPIVIGVDFVLNDRETYYSYIIKDYFAYAMPNQMYYHLIKYNDNVNYNNVYEAFNSFTDDDIYGMACGKKFTLESILGFSDSINVSDNSMCVPLVVDQSGTPEIDIMSLVDDDEEITIKEDKTIEVSFVVSNDSKSPLYDGTVTTTVPKDIEIIEDSISDKGTYDEETRKITWNIRYLDGEDDIELSYKTKVKVDIIQAYVFSATLNSNLLEQPIDSSIATIIVKDSLINPYTGNLINIVYILLAITFVAAILIYKRKKYINNI